MTTLELTARETEAIEELRHSYPEDIYAERLYRTSGGLLFASYRRHDQPRTMHVARYYIDASGFAKLAGVQR